MKIKTNKNLAKLTPKKFILNHLIPFILRDAGHGFAMDTWKKTIPKNFIANAKEDGDETPLYFDDINRRVPACGTVACIGGSIQCLTGINVEGSYSFDAKTGSAKKMAKLLGLSLEETKGLFYDWYGGEGGWPQKFAEQFEKAETPYKKARVACALLRQIALKGSKVFDYQKEQEND